MKTVQLLLALFLISSITYAQDTTSYRMIGLSNDGEIVYYNNDSTDLDAIPTTPSTGHAIFVDPVDSALYAVLDLSGGDRNLYSLNPFTGATNLVFDFTDGYIHTADIGESQIVYAVTGNGSNTPAQVYSLDLNTMTETILYTSSATDSRAIEYNPVDSSLYIYEGFMDLVYVYNLATGTETLLATTGMSNEIHGAFFDTVHNQFHVSTYDGDLYLTDNSYLNGTTYYVSPDYSIMDLCQINLLEAEANTISFCPGDSTIIKLRDTGTNVKWYQDGNLLPSTSQSIVAKTDGIYQALVEIGTGPSLMWSEPITVDLFTLPVINLSAVDNDSIICPGETITLNGNNAGGGSLQWYKNGQAIPGETSNTLSVNSPGAYNQSKTNLSGCTDTASVPFIVYDCSLGINDVHKDLFKVFPNPVKTSLHIIGNETEILNITVYDLAGRALLTVSPNQTEYTLDFNTLPKGIFWIAIKSDQNRVMEKIVKF